jgi:hypothetical protein
MHKGADFGAVKQNLGHLGDCERWQLDACMHAHLYGLNGQLLKKKGVRCPSGTWRMGANENFVRRSSGLEVLCIGLRG